MTNPAAGYGGLTKLFHWLIVILIALQYVGGNIMTRIYVRASYTGISTNTYFNWHKSLGLLALVVAIARILNRRVGRLPPSHRRYLHFTSVPIRVPTARYRPAEVENAVS